MFHKIIATMLTISLVSPLTFAQEMPGSALPVTSTTSEQEIVPVLNSAPGAPSDFETLSEIIITPEFDEAVFAFSTDVAVNAVIEYGLTEEYNHALSTEAQKIHTETLGELQECSTYYYHVRVSDVSSFGEFKTRCPVIKKVVKKTTPVVKKTVTPTKKIEQKQQKETGMVDLEKQPTINDTQSTIHQQELILNAAPEQKPEPEQKIETGIRPGGQIIGSDNPVNLENSVIPETPALPGPIAFGNDTLTKEKTDTKSMIPVGLMLFALLSGMVVMLSSVKKKKKWYQK